MKNGILYLDTFGDSIAVSQGQLLAGGYAYIPGAHGLKIIVMNGHGSISCDAVRWLAQEHVTCLIASGANCFAILGDAPAGRAARAEQALRLRQMVCVLDPRRRLEAARAIVAAKIETLGLGREDRQSSLKVLAKARTLQDVIVAEAQATALYWRRYRGFELQFNGNCA